MRAIVPVLAAAIGCGDNAPQKCEVPAASLPTAGAYIDPYAFELPADCVEGGLGALPGRWFVRDPRSEFSFEYPRIEGSCDAGFQRVSSAPDDHDDSDGATLYTWSDGTRFFRRSELH